MGRFVLLLSILLAVSSVVARADVPDPANCLTSLDGPRRLLMIPDGMGDLPAASFTVTIRNSQGIPINNCLVEFLVGGLATNHTRLCAAQQTNGSTNANGVLAFNMGGGGCYRDTDAFIIRADGVEIRNFDITVSPDYAGSDDHGVPGRSDLRVTPVDLAAFVVSYQGGVGASGLCQDYNNNGIVDPGDLGVFVSAYKGGTNFCNP